MKKIALIFSIILITASVLLAGDAPPKKRVIKEVVAPKTQLSKRLLFLVDISGSMQTKDKIKSTIDFVKMICEQPIDEFEMAIIAFGDNSYKWEGFPCDKDDPKPCPAGWAKMPNAKALEAAQTWISAFKGNQSTNAILAFKEALAEKQSDVSVILVTDGDYDQGHIVITKAIAEGQAVREADGRGRLVFYVLGIDVGTKKDDLAETAKESNGGFWQEVEE